MSDVEIKTLTMNFGPQHPAAHGVLRLVVEMDGEIIERCDPHIGLLHRGTEKLIEYKSYLQAVPYFDRLDYVSPMSQEHAFALAVEKLLGIIVPERGQYIRVLFAELTRVLNHLLNVTTFAMDTGAMTVFLYTFYEREKLYNLIEMLTGARFTTSYTRIGGQTHDLSDAFIAKLREFCREFPAKIDETDTLLSRNPIFINRTKDIAVISRERAIAYALSGPNLRGSGIEHDVRKAHPYLDYDKYDFDIPVGTVGDCYDRYLVRMLEMRESVKILNQVLDHLPDGPINVENQKGFLPPKELVLKKMEELIHQFMLVTEGIKAPPGEVYFGAENPKGELGFYIYSKGGGVPHRLKIRAPSFVNLSILHEILPGHMMSDVVAVLGSLDFVMGECDR